MVNWLRFYETAIFATFSWNFQSHYFFLRIFTFPTFSFETVELATFSLFQNCQVCYFFIWNCQVCHFHSKLTTFPVHGKITYEWHTDGTRVYASDIRMTYEYIRVTYGWHTSTYSFELFTKIKKGSGISFWSTFSAWVFHTDALYVILNKFNT